MKNEPNSKVAVLYSGGRFYGGIESYISNLFNRVGSNNIEMELLSLGEWPLTRQLQKDGIKVTLFDKKRISLKTIIQIGRYSREQRFNLLVAHGMVASTYARIVSFIYKIPNLVTVHSTRVGDYPNRLIRIIYGLIEKSTRFSTVKYIAVSQYIKNQLVKSGVPADKIVVIYSGLDFSKPTQKAHKRLVIGSVGRLHYVKGYDLLIRAFALLDNKRLRLKIAGDGDELEYLKKQARELGVLKRVEFVGFQENVYQFLNSLDVYVQPSRSEGFGLAVVEAMSQTLPVVVTPVGSLKEIIKNNQTGFISRDLSPAELAKSLSKTIKNIDMSKQVGQNASRFVIDKFDAERWVSSTIKIYKEVMK
jgi:glycosyltransferase involved in cell wall biosynthesis